VGPTADAARDARDRRPRGSTDRLARAVAAYLAAVRDGGRSPQTVALYRAALARFVRWLDGQRPGAACADLDHALVDAYVRHLRHDPARGREAPLADRSVRQYVVVLKLFARWGARGRRFWPESPLGDYEAPGFTETDIVPFTRDELAALLAACGPDTTFMGRRLRAMLLVALDTGLRRGELSRLTVPLVDLDTGRVRLPAALTKTRRPRTVHLQRAALAALRSWLAARDALPGVRADAGPLFCGLGGAALGDGAMQELAVRLRACSGVGRFRWHLLRHTAGTESLRNGADSLDVQEALGHTTPAMTRRYLHLTDDDRRARHARYSPVEALFGATAGAAEPRGRRLRRGAAPG
jgi:integrase/recombinase XerC